MAEYATFRVCAICGEIIESRDIRAKFCYPCKRKRTNELKRERSKREKQLRAELRAEATKDDNAIYFNDSLENIKTCLNCSRVMCLYDMNRICPDVHDKKYKRNRKKKGESND